jgi:uncharacterized protein
MQLLNVRTDEVVASAVEVAVTRATRRHGLLGRDWLDPAAALVLSPCFAVHTAFMRFPIDVLFVDSDDVVCRIVRELPPWRIAIEPRARAVIELAAGAAASRVAVGDRVYLWGVSGAVEGAWSGASLARPSLRRIASKPACSGS